MFVPSRKLRRRSGKHPAPTVLEVRRQAGAGARGRVVGRGGVEPASLGRDGITGVKREGDFRSPRGRFGLVAVFYRPDRLRRPASRLPVRALRQDDGWCDAATDRNYNRPVRHPYPASAERMWRDDALYDVVVVLDQNLTARARGRGSAVFLHCAAPGFRPTAGCVALPRARLLRLLARLPHDAVIAIGDRRRPVSCSRRLRLKQFLP